MICANCGVTRAASVYAPPDSNLVAVLCTLCVFQAATEDRINLDYVDKLEVQPVYRRERFDPDPAG